jgi:predicted regulator of Ras-like GTPase activity (Roadblock/LC7/MglB family)
MDIETALKEAMNIEGALGAALVDWESGMPLGTLGGSKYLDMELAAAGNTEVVRANKRAMQSLNLNDTIEDILITMGKQYHLVRLLANADGAHNLFLYLALDRPKANLALARHQLKRIETDLTV